ncbi:hypothetical protein HUU05_05795 [candidate division KSB1 bacterium]|nr:hypothetical protein [candidate division KSB1 bacterium]
MICVLRASAITTTAVNDAPVASNQTVTTSMNTAVPITLNAADVHNATLRALLLSFLVPRAGRGLLRSSALKNPRIAQKNRQPCMNEEGDEHQISEGQVQRMPMGKRACGQCQCELAALQKELAREQRKNAARHCNGYALLVQTLLPCAQSSPPFPPHLKKCAPTGGLALRCSLRYGLFERHPRGFKMALHHFDLGVDFFEREQHAALVAGQLREQKAPDKTACHHQHHRPVAYRSNAGEFKCGMQRREQRSGNAEINVKLEPRARRAHIFKHT